MKTIGSTIIMLALASSLFADNGKELKLASPDGTHEIVFYQKQDVYKRQLYVSCFRTHQAFALTCRNHA